MPMDTIPAPRDDDDEDVHWALSTATALWARGEHAEALRWLRRAAETASDAEADARALELFKAAADAAGTVGTRPPPPGEDRATSVPETVATAAPSVRPPPSRAVAPPPAPSRPPASIRPSPAAASARPGPPSVLPAAPAVPAPRSSARAASGTTPPASGQRAPSAWPVPSQRATQPSEIAPGAPRAAARTPEPSRSTQVSGGAGIAPKPISPHRAAASAPSSRVSAPRPATPPEPAGYDDLDEETRVLDDHEPHGAATVATSAPRPATGAPLPSSAHEPSAATRATPRATDAPRALEPEGPVARSTIAAMQVALLSGGAGQVEVVPLASLDASVRAPRAVLVPLSEDDARALAAMFAAERG
jgi:hypothetical protein